MRHLCCLRASTVGRMARLETWTRGVGNSKPQHGIQPSVKRAQNKHYFSSLCQPTLGPCMTHLWIMVVEPELVESEEGACASHAGAAVHQDAACKEENML